MPRFAWAPDDLQDFLGQGADESRGCDSALDTSSEQAGSESVLSIASAAPLGNVSVPQQLATPQRRSRELPVGDLHLLPPSQIPRPHGRRSPLPSKESTLPAEAAAHLANTVGIVSKLQLSLKMELDEREVEVRMLRRALSELAGEEQRRHSQRQSASGGQSQGRCPICSSMSPACTNGRGAIAGELELLRSELSLSEARERDTRVELETERQQHQIQQAQSAEVARVLREELTHLRNQEAWLLEQSEALRKAVSCSNHRMCSVEVDLERCRMAFEDMRSARGVLHPRTLKSRRSEEELEEEEGVYGPSASVAAAAVLAMPRSRGPSASASERSLQGGVGGQGWTGAGGGGHGLGGAWTVGRTRSSRLGFSSVSPHGSPRGSFREEASTPTRSNSQGRMGSPALCLGADALQQAAVSLLSEMFSGESSPSPNSHGRVFGSFGPRRSGRGEALTSSSPRSTSIASAQTEPGPHSVGLRSLDESPAPSPSPAVRAMASSPPRMMVAHLISAAERANFEGCDSANSPEANLNPLSPPRQEKPMLLPLNGRMPSFPSAELASPRTRQSRRCEAVRRRSSCPSFQVGDRRSLLEADGSAWGHRSSESTATTATAESTAPSAGASAESVVAKDLEMEDLADTSREGAQSVVVAASTSPLLRSSAARGRDVVVTETVAGAVARAMGSPEPWVFIPLALPPAAAQGGHEPQSSDAPLTPSSPPVGYRNRSVVQRIGSSRSPVAGSRRESARNSCGSTTSSSVVTNDVPLRFDRSAGVVVTLTGRSATESAPQSPKGVGARRELARGCATPSTAPVTPTPQPPFTPTPTHRCAGGGVSARTSPSQRRALQPPKTPPQWPQQPAHSDATRSWFGTTPIRRP